MPERQDEISVLCCYPIWTLEVTDSSSDEQEEREEKFLEEYKVSPRSIPLNKIQELQKRDYQLRHLKKIVKVSKGSKIILPSLLEKYRPYIRNILWDKDCLWIEKGGGKKPLLPFKTMIQVVIDTHYTMAHIGWKKLKEIILKDYWHPEINTICDDVTGTCPWCQCNKPKTMKIIPPTQKIQTNYPFELMAIDLVEFPKSRTGKVCCLSVVDHNTKWVNMVPLNNKKAITVTKAFEKTVLPGLVRKPTTILSDNGPEFRSEVFKEMLKSYGIEHIYTTPYKPSSNGAVERVNRTLTQFLKGLLQFGTDWEDELTRAVMVYNNTYHEEIKMSPSDMMLVSAHSPTGMALPRKSNFIWKEGGPGFLVSYRPGKKVLK